MRIDPAIERRDRDALIEELMRSAFELAWAVNHEAGKRAGVNETLTFSRLMVLRLLAKPGPRKVSEVAAFLGVSDADASNIVEKLVSRKLLRRVESRVDRRIRELSLTPTARRLLSQYETARKLLLAETFRQCSSEELHRASEVLDRVSWCVARHGQAANSGKKPARGESRPATPSSGQGGL